MRFENSTPPHPRQRLNFLSVALLFLDVAFKKTCLSSFQFVCAILTKNGNPSAGMYPREQKGVPHVPS